MSDSHGDASEAIVHTATMNMPLPRSVADLRRIVEKLDARNVPDGAMVMRIGAAGHKGFQIIWNPDSV